ncbi:DMT family transporter [Cypionkella sp.]|uniref:DMT family transporter n=1 Tax=Cypionkella sp. TaxID=2811411 RepID=UPI00271F7663|nr:DMT family transporter [Cypionkella sp.]MDO8982849.1 DMT family transporter [Cypionkella sp.]MDP2049597.1 DMT family transporter [Cypionkella sp.]
MSAKDWTRLAILSLLWGGSFFFVAVALQGLPTLSVVWARVGLGAGFLALALWVSGTAFPKGIPVWRALAVMGLLNNAVPFTLFVLAQGRISGGMASILNATTPLWGVLLAHLLTEEKITIPKAAGLTCGFAGVVVMMGGAALADIWASLACLGAAFSYGLAGIWGRRFRSLGVPPLATAFGQVMSAAVMLLPIWLLVDRPWSLAVPGLLIIGAVLAIAAFSTALAYLIYFRLLASAGPTNLLLVTFLVPVSACLLGAVFLGDAISGRQLAGFGLIAAGLVALDGRVLKWL